jgi:hypothetical protein
VTEPPLAAIRRRLSEPEAIDSLRRGAAKIARAHLRAAPELWRDVLAGRCPVC